MGTRRYGLERTRAARLPATLGMTLALIATNAPQARAQTTTAAAPRAVAQPHNAPASAGAMQTLSWREHTPCRQVQLGAHGPRARLCVVEHAGIGGGARYHVVITLEGAAQPALDLPVAAGALARETASQARYYEALVLSVNDDGGRIVVADHPRYSCAAALRRARETPEMPEFARQTLLICRGRGAWELQSGRYVHPAATTPAPVVFRGGPARGRGGDRGYHAR